MKKRDKGGEIEKRQGYDKKLRNIAPRNISFGSFERNENKLSHALITKWK